MLPQTDSCGAHNRANASRSGAKARFHKSKRAGVNRGSFLGLARSLYDYRSIYDS